MAFAGYSVTLKGMADERVDRIAWWVVAANLFNAVWLFLWHYEPFPFKLIAMLGLLASLLVVYLRLRVGIRVAQTGRPVRRPRRWSARSWACWRWGGG